MTVSLKTGLKTGTRKKHKQKMINEEEIIRSNKRDRLVVSKDRNFGKDMRR